eukprot:CAMPEP_0167744786 /NCGR_PEP_ID=MMETSP0110_2-20121227/2784_1 /TAXON_ID=629695 /ORGANISM="Gymnochlora sp., Strain CCMP2014" /LENGTH=208 /DNA_ID=CAMNT_0007629345 /DNA_START=1 /DNA_END=624 /DNA_ORIENTATION=-
MESAEVARALRRYEDWKHEYLQDLSEQQSSSNDVLSSSHSSSTAPGIVQRLLAGITKLCTRISRFSLIPSPEGARMEDWGSEIIPKVMRVNQLDAQTLDEDLHQLLWVGLKRIARHGGQEFLGAFGFEIRALLKLLVFVNTTGVNKPTPGLELQNLRLVGTGIHKSISKMGLAARLLSRRERVFYGGMTIVAPWILERLKSHMTDWEW